VARIGVLPDGRILAAEKKGNLFIVTEDGKKSGNIGGHRSLDSSHAISGPSLPRSVIRPPSTR
jgi:hypothetical protein